MKHPIQPITQDAHGRQRFKANAIVQHLLSTHPACNMNVLHTLPFSVEDRQQFAQLIGYSLDGYGTLSYVDDLSFNTAQNTLTGADDRDATIAALEQKLAELREAIDALREPIARIFEMHPDDLKGG